VKSIILILVMLVAIFMHTDNAGWRGNRYEYREAWFRNVAEIYHWEETELWLDGEFLLWHGEESFQLVYSARRWDVPSIVATGERIGLAGGFPMINPHRADINYLRMGHVYEIQGLNSDEWIYVIYEELHNWTLMTRHHRIYMSTALEMENPL